MRAFLIIAAFLSIAGFIAALGGDPFGWWLGIGGSPGTLLALALMVLSPGFGSLILAASRGKA